VPAESHQIRLPEDCDTGWAVEFHAALTGAGALPLDMVIDGAGVQRVTTPAIQLLLSIARSIGAENGQFSLQNPAPVLRDALTHLGLETLVQEWESA